MNEQYSTRSAEAAVAGSADGRYAVMLARGTLELGYYMPRHTDPQQPHRQDEIYIIARGSGVFVKAGEPRRFKQGDALFVAAGVAHHFEDFSDDFAAWVVFCGADGGEVSGDS